ncbi:MAG: hypothetical protein QOF72_2927 [Blastocatellia bacterium]|nr:hypothetical protein [Blastocatellia bacterium]
MKRFIVKSAIFVLILWIACDVLALRLDAVFREDRSNKEAWVLSQHARSVDYAIAGSSRAFNIIDATTLARETGHPALNLAYGGQSIMDMYLTLHLFLAHENRIGTLLLQIDGSDLDYSHEFLAHLYLPYVNDPEVAHTIREVRGLKRYIAMKSFPLAKYWEYNDFYDFRRFEKARSGVSTYDSSAGSELLYDDNYHVFPANLGDPNFVVDRRSVQYLDRIYQLTRSRDIRLILFSAPQYHPDAFNHYDEASRAYILGYCQERSIPYLDFSQAHFDQSEFRDYGHLNGRGALRFTSMLADSVEARRSTTLPERGR